MAGTRSRGRIVVIVVVAVIVLAAVGYFAREQFGLGPTAGAADSTAVDSTGAATSSGDETEKKEPVRVPVEVARAGVREISAYYVTTATLEPEKKVDILAKVGGEVVEVLAEEGDRVKKGDMLCRLEDDEQRVALDEARINRDQRKREVERLESMHEQNLISDKEFGDVRYQYELAKNGYEQALLRYRYTRIRAPFDGIVTERLVDTGENISVGARLYVVSDTEPLLLEMYLPEAEIREIEPGQLVYINPDVDETTIFEGRIVRVAPEVDQSTGTVKVTAETRGGGIPGSFVRVRIVTDTRPAALTVPRRSVVADSGDRFVFVASADTVRQVGVDVGYEDQEYAEILAGIAEGDSVVTAGVGGIRTGTKVRVLDGPDENKDELTEAARN